MRTLSVAVVPLSTLKGASVGVGVANGSVTITTGLTARSVPVSPLDVDGTRKCVTGKGADC